SFAERRTKSGTSVPARSNNWMPAASVTGSEEIVLQNFTVIAGNRVTSNDPFAGLKNVTGLVTPGGGLAQEASASPPRWAINAKVSDNPMRATKRNRRRWLREVIGGLLASTGWRQSACHGFQPL